MPRRRLSASLAANPVSATGGPSSVAITDAAASAANEASAPDAASAVAAPDAASAANGRRGRRTVRSSSAAAMARLGKLVQRANAGRISGHRVRRKARPSHAPHGRKRRAALRPRAKSIGVAGADGATAGGNAAPSTLQRGPNSSPKPARPRCLRLRSSRLSNR